MGTEAPPPPTSGKIGVQRVKSRPLTRPRSQDGYSSRVPLNTQTVFSGQPEEPGNDGETNDENQPKDIESQHQVACPRNKVKGLRNRENNKIQNREDLHPRAWGVRSPKEIPCTCNASKIDKKFSKDNANLSPFNLKSPAHTEINKAILNACKQIDKVKVNLGKEEIKEFTNKIKLTLEKKLKSQPKSAEKKPLRKVSSATGHVQKLNANSKTMPQDKQHTYLQRLPSTAPNDTNVMLTPTAVVGTMESTNYVIELTSQSSKQNAGEIKNLMSQVMPMPIGSDKAKLVSVDGAYFAEIPNDYNAYPPVSQVCTPDSGMLRKRTENVTFYAMADQKQQKIMYAKPKSAFGNSKYVPVTKIPLHLHHTPQPVNKPALVNKK